jgi:hypothetical protein
MQLHSVASDVRGAESAGVRGKQSPMEAKHAEADPNQP